MMRHRTRTGALLLIAAFALALPSARADQNDEQILAAIESAVKSNSATIELTDHWIELLLQEGPSIPVKERTAWGLGFVGGRNPRTVPALLKAAEHKGLLVRSAAVNALIRLRAKSALGVLEDVARHDPILALRRDATLGLGLLESEKAIAPLVDLSSDNSPEVRGAAALAMSAFQSKKNDFRSALKEMTADENPYVKTRAAAALLIAQHKNVSVRSQLSSPDRDIRLFTALYFLRHGTAADKKSIQAAFDGESDDEVRALLANANAALKKKSGGKKTGVSPSHKKKHSTSKKSHSAGKPSPQSSP